MISIITVVKDDPALKLTLDKLTNIKSSRYSVEIIVVDASQGRLDYIRDVYPMVKWINFVALNKKITIAEQRNIGVKESKGEIIVFVDSGCIPHEGWLEVLTKPMFNESEKIVAGSTCSEGASTIHDRTSKINAFKTYLHECPTINTAISREVFKETGYFDENFEAGEDVDFMWRAVDLGFKIRNEPAAVVTHDWGNRVQEVIRSFRYGKGRARVYLKHKSKLGSILKRDPIAVFYPIFILGLPLLFFVPYYPLLLIIPLIKNRNEKPITTLIDHLLYGAGFITGLITLK